MPASQKRVSRSDRFSRRFLTFFFACSFLEIISVQNDAHYERTYRWHWRIGRQRAPIRWDGTVRATAAQIPLQDAQSGAQSEGQVRDRGVV